jgi:hypothetical protein
MGCVTTDKTQLKVYVRSSDLLDALKRAAKDDARSVSVLVDLILTEWLGARGYIAGDRKAPSKPKGKPSKLERGK